MRREPTSKPADLRPGLTVAPAALVASEALASLSPEELADLGQITHPYRKTNEECGFTRITWEEAYRLAAHHLKPLDGDQLGFVAGPLASSDEGLYSFAKWAHALGCSNIDGWDQSNWRQSATPFLSTLGETTSTSQPDDLQFAEGILLWGVEPGEFSRPLLKHLLKARKRGAWVACLLPVESDSFYREWSLSRLMNAPAQNRTVDTHLSLRPGGEGAFGTALLQRLVADEKHDPRFVRDHTTGWPQVNASLMEHSQPHLLDLAGVSPIAFQQFYEKLSGCSDFISIVGNGVSMPPTGAATVQSILNLHLGTGAIGKRGSGLINMTGNPGSSTAGILGIDPDHLPGPLPIGPEHIARWSEQWDFPVHKEIGKSATRSFLEAHTGVLKGLICLGTMFPPNRCMNIAGPGPEIRIHLSSMLDKSALLPAETTLLLPILPPEQSPETTCFSSTFRTLYLCEGGAHPVGPKPVWRVISELSKKSCPNLAGHLRFSSARSIRAELTKHFESHAPLDKLTGGADQIRWGPPVTGAGGRFLKMPDQKASLRPITLLPALRKSGQVYVQNLGDSFQGQRTILVSPEDGQRYGLQAGEKATLTSRHSTLDGYIAFGTVRAGCVWVYQADLLDSPEEWSALGWRLATIHGTRDDDGPGR